MPTEPAEGHAHGHDAHEHDRADEPAGASASAVETDTEQSSGVDVHLSSEKHQQDSHAHSREPFLMIAPLIVLAIGAIGAGFLNWPRHELGEFLAHSPSIHNGYRLANALRGVHHETALDTEGFGFVAAPNELHGEVEHSPLFSRVMIISTLIAFAGILLAWLLHYKDRLAADKLAEDLRPATKLLEGKYYVDEIYQALIVEPLRMLGQICFAIDRFIIDGLVWLISFIPQVAGFSLKLTTQRGSLQGYGLTMMFGVVIILLVVVFG